MVVRVIENQSKPRQTKCLTCECLLEYYKIDIETNVYQQTHVVHSIKCPNCKSNVYVDKNHPPQGR